MYLSDKSSQELQSLLHESIDNLQCLKHSIDDLEEILKVRDEEIDFLKGLKDNFLQAHIDSIDREVSLQKKLSEAKKASSKFEKSYNIVQAANENLYQEKLSLLGEVTYEIRTVESLKLKLIKKDTEVAGLQRTADNRAKSIVKYKTIVGEQIDHIKGLQTVNQGLNEVNQGLERQIEAYEARLVKIEKAAALAKVTNIGDPLLDIINKAADYSEAMEAMEVEDQEEN